MRKRAGIIMYCKSKDKILLIKRVKKELQYWVVPGGGLESGESFEQAAKREMFEEIGYCVEKLTEGITISREASIEKYYFTSVDDTYNFVIQGEEAERNTKSNQYVLEWVAVDKIKEINLFPEELKNLILEILMRL